MAQVIGPQPEAPRRRTRLHRRHGGASSPSCDRDIARRRVSGKRAPRRQAARSPVATRRSQPPAVRGAGRSGRRRCPGGLHARIALRANVRRVRPRTLPHGQPERLLWMYSAEASTVTSVASRRPWVLSRSLVCARQAPGRRRRHACGCAWARLAPTDDRVGLDSPPAVRPSDAGPSREKFFAVGCGAWLRSHTP